MEINLSFQDEKGAVHGKLTLDFTVMSETLIKLLMAARESNFVQVAARILSEQSGSEEKSE